MKKNDNSPHQQSLLANDADVTSDVEDTIYTRILKDFTPYTSDTTLHDGTFYFVTNTKTDLYTLIYYLLLLLRYTKL